VYVFEHRHGYWKGTGFGMEDFSENLQEAHVMNDPCGLISKALYLANERGHDGIWLANWTMDLVEVGSELSVVGTVGKGRVTP